MFKLPEYRNLFASEEELRKNMAKGAEKASQVANDRFYRYPKTEEEWWKVAREWWPDFIVIANKYIDVKAPIDLYGNLSLKPYIECATKALNEKDPILSSFFSKVWQEAPDNGTIHSNIGWGVLCDLCSESYLIHEDYDAE